MAADFEFRVDGLAALNAALLELGTNGARRAGKKAMRQGANVILHATRDAAPVRTGNLSRKGFHTHDHGIQGDMVFFSVDLKKSAFYGKFLEFGTSKMAARPFMRPAAENYAKDAVAVIAAVLGEQIAIEAEKAR
jgi:HK97 gp10 family phage protein